MRVITADWKGRELLEGAKSSVEKNTALDKALNSLSDHKALEQKLCDVWLRYQIEKGSRSLEQRPTNADAKKAAGDLKRAISLLENAPGRFVRRHSDPQLFDTIVWYLKQMHTSWLAVDIDRAQSSEHVDPLIVWAAAAVGQIYADLTGRLLPRSYGYGEGKSGHQEFAHDGLEFTYQILHQIDDTITRAMVATSLRKNVKSNSTA